MKLTRITEVQALGARRVRLTLTDGESFELDLSEFLNGPIFEQVREDDAYFAQVRVDPELGTIVWPNGADIDPDVLIQRAHASR